MKKTIIYLGIFATMFVSTTLAKTVEMDQQNLETEVSSIDSNVTSENKLSKPVISIESDEKVIASVEIIATHYKKTIEEVIEEDKKITESTEELYQPLFITPTIEDYIRLDNQIIDSTIPNEVYPIDVELINQTNPMSNLDVKSEEGLKS